MPKHMALRIKQGYLVWHRQGRFPTHTTSVKHLLWCLCFSLMTLNLLIQSVCLWSPPPLPRARLCTDGIGGAHAQAPLVATYSDTKSSFSPSNLFSWSGPAPTVVHGTLVAPRATPVMAKAVYDNLAQPVPRSGFTIGSASSVSMVKFLPWSRS